MSTRFSRTVAHKLLPDRDIGFTVALVGADGAGKSTISRILKQSSLPLPVKTIYMGVNLEESTLMLPSTRLLLALKRVRAEASGLPMSEVRGQSAGATVPRPRTWRRSAKDAARLTGWMLEEWLRQAVTLVYTARGYIVVFDRHFFADYYRTDSTGDDGVQGTFARAHGWMLRHAYPRPDLVISLDAPAEVLFARKPEATVSWLEQRRRQYLHLEDAVSSHVVIDADRPLDHVVSDVMHTIRTHWKSLSA